MYNTPYLLKIHVADPTHNCLTARLDDSGREHKCDCAPSQLGLHVPILHCTRYTVPVLVNVLLMYKSLVSGDQSHGLSISSSSCNYRRTGCV